MKITFEITVVVSSIFGSKGSTTTATGSGFTFSEGGRPILKPGSLTGGGTSPLYKANSLRALLPPSIQSNPSPIAYFYSKFFMIRLF